MRNRYEHLIEEKQMAAIGYVFCLLFIIGLIYAGLPSTFSPTVYQAQQLEKINEKLRQGGAIIHKDYGTPGLKCIELDGNFLIIDVYGRDSSMIKVDSCDARKGY